MTTPLEVAEIIERSSPVTRDPVTGLYVLDGTVPETTVTLALYEQAQRVLHLRELARAGKGR